MNASAARIRWTLLLLPATFLLALFVVPMLMMVVISFRPDLRGGPFVWGWEPTLKHYQTVIGGDDYLPLLGTSMRIALLVSLVVCILAYPVAYYLAFRIGKSTSLLLTLLIIPFWTSYLLRMIAWKIILGSNGALNNFLGFLGVTDGPASFLLYSRRAVIVTLVYVWLPFVALPIYASLLRIDRSLLEAAADLGASRIRAFLKVTLPLSLPGVIAAFGMVFIPSVGEYVAPILVGGTRGSMYGNIIEILFGDGINWPLGSAMAILMLVGVLALVIVLGRVLRLGRLIEASER